MLAHYINVCFIIIKALTFFIVYIIVFDFIYIKLLAILILFSLFYKISKPEKTRFKKLSELRAYGQNKYLKYRINSKTILYFNAIYLSIYIILFILLLVVRLINMNSKIDLIVLFFQVFAKFILLKLSDIIVNILLLICIMLVIITIMKYLRKRFHFEAIRRHIYHVMDTRYEKIFYFLREYTFLNCIRYPIHEFIENCYMYIPTKKWSWTHMTAADEVLYDNFKNKRIKIFNVTFNDIYTSIYHISTFVMLNIHHNILLSTILYDLWSGNWVLIHMFIVLPFVYLYSTYISVSRFIESKDIMGLDVWIHRFYYRSIIILDRKHAIIDGNLEEINDSAKDFAIYEARGFCKV
jgi:hypothetical protein